MSFSWRRTAQDLGLLLLRGTGALLLLNHGLHKLTQFSALAPTFPDPIGLGPTVSLVLTIVGEVVSAGLIVLGLVTRFACVPLIVTMAVAAFVVHGGDPWAKKEMSLLYLLPAVTLLLTGPGGWSLDRILFNKR